MASSNFGRAGINTRSAIRPTSGDLSRAGAVRGQLGFAPTRESTHFSDRAANTAGMPRSNFNGNFVSRQGTSGVNRTGGSVASAPVNRAVGGSQAGGSQGGWQRFNPSQGGAANQGSVRGPSNPQGTGFNRGTASGAPQGGGSQGGGWQRFNPGQNSGQAGGSQGRVAPSGGNAPMSRPSYSQGSSGRSVGQQQPVRISPPMVRSNPGGGGAGYSPRPAPQNQAPRSAPAAPRSAPAPRSSGGGGGGGSPHSSGGGHGGRGR